MSPVHFVASWCKDSKIIDPSENTQMRSLSFFHCTLNMGVFRKVSNPLSLFLNLSFFKVGWQCHETFQIRHTVLLILLSHFCLPISQTLHIFIIVIITWQKRRKKCRENLRQQRGKVTARMELFSHAKSNLV